MKTNKTDSKGSFIISNPKLDCIFVIPKIVNKGVPEVMRFVLFVNVAPME